jgi:murein DD-endopeptidase MepM/ murein hydrolase activator NlpD
VITSHFGYREVSVGSTYHRGIDIGADGGSPIAAARSGQVTYAGYNDGGYGYLVIVDHGDGASTYYAHCSELLVSEGDTVSQGQTIALVGSTGVSTGDHCHFEIRLSDEPVDPLDYLPEQP